MGVAEVTEPVGGGHGAGPLTDGQTGIDCQEKKRSKFRNTVSEKCLNIFFKLLLYVSVIFRHSFVFLVLIPHLF